MFIRLPKRPILKMPHTDGSEMSNKNDFNYRTWLSSLDKTEFHVKTPALKPKSIYLILELEHAARLYNIQSAPRDNYTEGVCAAIF